MWARIETQNEIHVVPQEGTPHEAENCWCEPTVKIGDGKGETKKVFSHNEDVWKDLEIV